MSIIRKVRHFSRKDLYVGPLIPALIVFAALMVIIGLSWRTAKQDVETQFAIEVSQNSTDVEETLVQRFGIYEDTLRSGAGLFNSSDNVTGEEWRTFVNSLKLPSRYPGIRSVGFVRVIGGADKNDFIESVRADSNPSFDIKPAGERDKYAATTYIIPTNDDIPINLVNAALGYDMYTDPVRREAMENAISFNGPALSDIVNLNRTGEGSLPGFLLYMPVYKKGMPIDSREDRVNALYGFSFAPFAADSFFSSLFTTKNPNFSFSITTDSAANRQEIYKSSKDFDSPDFKEAKRNSLSLYGKSWTVVYKTSPDIVSGSLRARPWSVIYGGTIFAIVTAMMVYLLIQRRTNSLAMAEQRRLEDAKDELLSLASHQLRTPATAVKQYVSMVIGGFAGKVSKEQKRLLEMAYDSNERQLTIVDDLLYVARLDAGQATLTYERFDLHKLLDSVIADQQLLIDSKKQKVILHAPRRKVFIEGDPKYIRMTLENLLSNASKYSKETKSINILLRTLKGMVFITFIDQGVGIGEDDYENIFQKFSRIPNELTNQASGSGIGLYLARQLSRLHGGDITLTSSLNKGSSFTLSLPLKPIP